jgi:hypothetical protein
VEPKTYVQGSEADTTDTSVSSKYVSTGAAMAFIALLLVAKFSGGPDYSCALLSCPTRMLCRQLLTPFHACSAPPLLRRQPAAPERVHPHVLPMNGEGAMRCKEKKSRRAPNRHPSASDCQPCALCCTRPTPLSWDLAGATAGMQTSASEAGSQHGPAGTSTDSCSAHTSAGTHRAAA